MKSTAFILLLLLTGAYAKNLFDYIGNTAKVVNGVLIAKDAAIWAMELVSFLTTNPEEDDFYSWLEKNPPKFAKDIVKELIWSALMNRVGEKWIIGDIIKLYF